MYIKKSFLTLVFTFIFFISSSNLSLAATIYSNNFTSSFNDFLTFFGTCIPSSNGLSCTNNALSVYSNNLNTIKCVYGDFTTSSELQPNTQHLLLWENTNINNLGQGALFYIPTTGNFRLGNYPISDIDSGVTAPSSGTHTYGLCKDGDRYTTYIDGIKIQSEVFTGLNTNQIGFQLTPNTTLTNFTATDTLPNQLDVALLKQTAEPWQSQEYDSAKKWNLANPTINAWGCAMTSAAMVFNYHGINKLPDGKDLDPGTLNAWLKSQPDGYVGTGWVNWLALARLSSKATDINNITTFDALEYNRVWGANKTQLTDDLENQIPGILEEPGHFIVATGVNGDTFDINDPYYNRETLHDSYNNTFLNLGRFVPSYTDLSYIMLVTDPNVTMTVTDENGNTVGESFIQNPIINPSDMTQTNSSINIYYLPKPATGTYTVKTVGNSTYTISSYLYDQEGEPQMENNTGIGTTTLTISFNKTSNADSSTQKTITFTSTIQDIKNAEKLHLINKGLGEALIAFVTTAQRQSDKHVIISKRLLDQGIKLLEKSRGHSLLIKESAYKILITDFTELKNSL